MLNKEHTEKNNRKGKSVRLLVRLSSENHLRRHIALFSGNTEIYSPFGNIVVVTDKHVSCLGINEEIAVIQVLIAVAVIMESTETLNNIYSGIAACSYTCKLSFHAPFFLIPYKESCKFLKACGTKLHNIAEAAVYPFGEILRPKKRLCRRTLFNI